jgi:hypothetical protein
MYFYVVRTDVRYSIEPMNKTQSSQLFNLVL